LYGEKMVARVEKQMSDLQPCLTSPNLIAPFQIGHADIGVMASLAVRKLHTIQRVRFQDACVILVLEGSKSVSDLDLPKHAETGDIAVIPAGTIADVTSKPKPSHAYRGVILSFEQSLLTRFSETYPHVVGSKQPLGQVKILKSAEDISDVVGRVIKDFEAGLVIDRDLLYHRLIEVLLTLAIHHCVFNGTRQPKLTERVGVLVATDLARNWTAIEVACEFAMSEATFRRRLARERTSFSAILAEARLGKGLFLLQSTELDITSIALEVGYQSPSHFTARFRRRYGVAPSDAR
jgi:AraC-like DNA-binding protein